MGNDLLQQMRRVNTLVKSPLSFVVPFGPELFGIWPKKSPRVADELAAPRGKMLPMTEASIKWFHGFLL
jgi:hypothetical protein